MEDILHMLLEGTVKEMIIKLDPTQIIHMVKQTGQNKCYMYNLKSPIQNSTSSTTVLETNIGDITGVGLHIEPI